MKATNSRRETQDNVKGRRARRGQDGKIKDNRGITRTQQEVKRSGARGGKTMEEKGTRGPGRARRTLERQQSPSN